MEILENFFDQLSRIIWGPAAWALLLAVGVMLSFKTNWFQITKFAHYMDRTIIDMFRKPENKKMKTEAKEEGDISQWQAINAALCATMGVGTLAGTATAIAFGGPGSIFWMWIVGFFGITTKFAEVVLAVHFRSKNEKGEILTGPFAYMEKGLGLKWLAYIFAGAGVLASFGIGNLAQSNSAATALESVFGWDRMIIGIVAAALIGIVILGGLKRIATVVDKLVPFLGAICIVSSLIIVLLNFTRIGHVFYLIFSAAFSAQGFAGGIAGVGVMYAVRFGLMRGVFSNEAGLGSGPIAHGTAQVDHPVKQGLWAAFEVFLDTHVMCTLIALVILINVPLADILPGTAPALTGAPLVIASYANSFLGETFGSWFMAILIALFGFSTVVGWAYYGEKCFEYLFGLKFVVLFRLVMIPVAVFGSMGGIALIWTISDNFNAFMAIPNVIAVSLLSGTVAKLTKDYFDKEKEKKEAK